jgi:hypothetical protein
VRPQEQERTVNYNNRFEDEDQAILDGIRERLGLIADGHVDEDGNEDSGPVVAPEAAPQAPDEPQVDRAALVATPWNLRVRRALRRYFGGGN